jgi:hypothetical protein
MQWSFITNTQAAFKRGRGFRPHHPLMKETKKNVDKARNPVKIYCCFHIRTTVRGAELGPGNRQILAT